MIFDYEDIEDASFDVNLPCDIKLLRIYADMLSKYFPKLNYWIVSRFCLRQQPIT